MAGAVTTATGFRVTTQPRHGRLRYSRATPATTTRPQGPPMIPGALTSMKPPLALACRGPGSARSCDRNRGGGRPARGRLPHHLQRRGDGTDAGHARYLRANATTLG